jgi:6-pyruvoyltetrahydropterin/6-carboxytetrahydropterin synthase
VVKALLAGILEELDHRELNAIPPFDSVNPSTENLARHVFERMREGLAGRSARMHRVKVSEGPNTSATYIGEP